MVNPPKTPELMQQALDAAETLACRLDGMETKNLVRWRLLRAYAEKTWPVVFPEIGEGGVPVPIRVEV